MERQACQAFQVGPSEQALRHNQGHRSHQEAERQVQGLVPSCWSASAVVGAVSAEVLSVALGLVATLHWVASHDLACQDSEACLHAEACQHEEACQDSGACQREEACRRLAAYYQAYQHLAASRQAYLDLVVARLLARQAFLLAYLAEEHLASLAEEHQACLDVQAFAVLLHPYQDGQVLPHIQAAAAAALELELGLVAGM